MSSKSKKQASVDEPNYELSVWEPTAKTKLSTLLQRSIVSAINHKSAPVAGVDVAQSTAVVDCVPHEAPEGEETVPHTAGWAIIAHMFGTTDKLHEAWREAFEARLASKEPIPQLQAADLKFLVTVCRNKVEGKRYIVRFGMPVWMVAVPNHKLKKVDHSNFGQVVLLSTKNAIAALLSLSIRASGNSSKEIDPSDRMTPMFATLKTQWTAAINRLKQPDTSHVLPEIESLIYEVGDNEFPSAPTCFVAHLADKHFKVTKSQYLNADKSTAPPRAAKNAVRSDADLPVDTKSGARALSHLGNDDSDDEEGSVSDDDFLKSLNKTRDDLAHITKTLSSSLLRAQNESFGRTLWEKITQVFSEADLSTPHSDSPTYFAERDTEVDKIRRVLVNAGVVSADAQYPFAVWAQAIALAQHLPECAAFLEDSSKRLSAPKMPLGICMVTPVSSEYTPRADVSVERRTASGSVETVPTDFYSTLNIYLRAGVLNTGNLVSAASLQCRDLLEEVGGAIDAANAATSDLFAKMESAYTDYKDLEKAHDEVQTALKERVRDYDQLAKTNAELTRENEDLAKRLEKAKRDAPKRQRTQEPVKPAPKALPPAVEEEI